MGSVFPGVRWFEPGTAGWEAQTLPLCYAVPPTCLWSTHQLFSWSKEKIGRRNHFRSTWLMTIMDQIISWQLKWWMDEWWDTTPSKSRLFSFGNSCEQLLLQLSHLFFASTLLIFVLTSKETNKCLKAEIQRDCWQRAFNRLFLVQSLRTDSAKILRISSSQLMFRW